MTDTTTDAAEVGVLLEAMQKDRSTEHGRAAFRLLRRFTGDYYYDEPTEREDWMLVFLATAEAASGAGEREGVPQARLPANKCGAVSDDAVRHLEIRSPLNRAIYKAIRGYDMSNMTDADDPSWPYPLVDLMSNPAPSDIRTGEMEMVSLADEVECAVREAFASLPPATDPAMGPGYVHPDNVAEVAACVDLVRRMAANSSLGRPFAEDEVIKFSSAHYEEARAITRMSLEAAPIIPATEEAIKAMVARFLAWPLPADFQPDNGISATRPNYGEGVEWRPIGTNLLTAAQAEAMIRHLLGGART